MRLKLKNVADVGLPESVNTLSVVADHANILLLFGQIADHRELQSIGILIFVNKYIFVALVIFCTSLRRCPEQFDRLDQKVVKVECIGCIEPLVVHLEDLCHRCPLFVAVFDLRGERVRVVAAILT